MNRLFIVPSFYIWTTWLIVLLALQFSSIDFPPLSPEVYSVFALVVLAAILSNLYFASKFDRVAPHINVNGGKTLMLAVFLTTTVIGSVGLASYIGWATNLVGGFDQYLFSLLNNPLAIRALSIDDLGGAIQLIYFSWISFAMAILIARRRVYSKFSRSIIVAIGAIEFIANLTFVDRTRPIWLIVISSLMIASTSKKPALAIGRLVVIFPFLIVGIFLGFVTFTNKITGASVFGELEGYLLGGVLYFNQLYQKVGQFDYQPIRTMYPISKLLNNVGLAGEVPSQVLNFYFVPFPTNVGTFMEPLYSDGGLGFVFLGMPLVIWLIDRVALWALKAQSFWGVFLYANLIFCDLMSTFVPKFTSTPLYVFFFLFVVSRAAQPFTFIRRPPAPLQRNASQWSEDWTQRGTPKRMTGNRVDGEK